MSNLPRQRTSTNTDQPLRDFFDQYYQARIEYPSNEVNAVVGFFNDRGFGEEASASLSTTLMRQARVDNVSTFKLLDTLEGLDDVQLSALVAEILNYSRIKSSTLGFRIRSDENYFEARNIAP